MPPWGSGTHTYGLSWSPALSLWFWAGGLVCRALLLASMYFFCEIVQDRATRVVLTC